MQNQLPEPQPEQGLPRQYFIGLGIGLIPLILALISIGGLFTGSTVFGSGLGIAVVLYIGLFIASIVCLFIKRIRFVGYGLLTMALASPVIVFIGCLVVIARWKP